MFDTGLLPIPWVIPIGGTFNPYLACSDITGLIPVDWTGWSGVMQIRASVADPNVIATLSTSNGGLSIPTPTNGIIYFLLTAAQTALMPPTRAVFDLQMTAPGSTEIDYLIQGPMIIQQMVTR